MRFDSGSGPVVRLTIALYSGSIDVTLCASRAGHVSVPLTPWLGRCRIIVDDHPFLLSKVTLNADNGGILLNAYVLVLVGHCYARYVQVLTVGFESHCSKVALYRSIRQCCNSRHRTVGTIIKGFPSQEKQLSRCTGISCKVDDKSSYIFNSLTHSRFLLSTAMTCYLLDCLWIYQYVSCPFPCLSEPFTWVSIISRTSHQPPCRFKQ